MGMSIVWRYMAMIMRTTEPRSRRIGKANKLRQKFLCNFFLTQAENQTIIIE